MVTSHPKALSQEGLRLLCQNIEIRQRADSQRGGDGEGGDDVQNCGFHGVCLSIFKNLLVELAPAAVALNLARR